MIHKFKQNGMYILLDVNSGGVHIIDELTYDLLDYVSDPPAEECPQAAIEALSGKYPAADLRECYAELYSLYKDQGDVLFVRYVIPTVRDVISQLCIFRCHATNLADTIFGFGIDFL